MLGAEQIVIWSETELSPDAGQAFSNELVDRRQDLGRCLRVA